MTIHTHPRTNGRTLPSALSPCFAVENKNQGHLLQYQIMCGDPYSSMVGAILNL